MVETSELFAIVLLSLIQMEILCFMMNVVFLSFMSDTTTLNSDLKPGNIATHCFSLQQIEDVVNLKLTFSPMEHMIYKMLCQTFLQNDSFFP